MLQVREVRLREGVKRLAQGLCPRSDGRGRVPHLWVLSCAFCAADSSFLRFLQPGFWGLSSPRTSLQTALALWGSNALLSSKCGGADTVVGVAKVTLYLAPPGCDCAG